MANLGKETDKGTRGQGELGDPTTEGSGDKGTRGQGDKGEIEISLHPTLYILLCSLLTARYSLLTPTWLNQIQIEL
ncbi:hypothetical protein [Chroococcidiopsis cubana]|uniref:hypothetical protein n=1 Tax=Chroococcidiopsis cubana TaxID=171392 RepID=UPI002ACDA045|nr:hypothetical protein [Chroococcidiopsis cubana]